MMDFLRRTWEQIAGFFRRMPLPNRVALGSLSAALVAVLVLFLSLSANDDKVPLVREQIDLAQADNVRRKLEEKGVPFDIRGGLIYVEPANRDALLMELYGEGVFTSDEKVVYKWVFDQDISETRGRRDLKWIVSRQYALAKMISSLDFVESAMVTLTRQPETLFQNIEKMNAAVRLKLKPSKSLTDDTVLGIARWVAFSVQGMEPQDVAIMDTAGTMYDVPDAESYSGSMRTHMKAIIAWEKYYEDRVRKLIMAQFGTQAGILARVQVDEEKMTTVKDGPTEVVEETTHKLKETEKNRTLQGPPGVDGENGTQTLDQLRERGGASATGTESEKTRDETTTTQAFPTEHIEREKPPGQVKSLTLVITAPYERLILRPNGTRAGWDATKKEVTNAPEAEKQVQDTIAVWKKGLALGLDVPVKNVDFIPSYFEKMVETPEPTKTETTLWWLETHWTKIVLLLASLVAVFLIWRVLRSSAPDDIEQELEKMRGELEASKPPEEEPIMVPAGEERAVEIKERIREAVRRNPRTAASLLKQWITRG